MKNTILLASILFGLNATAASELVLDPGSKVTVNAGDTLIIACSGTGGGATPGNADCTVMRGGQTDKYGTTCNESSYYYCSNYYEFGTRITYQTFYSDPAGAANWCKDRLKK